jgi:hypothetical protein
MEKICCELDAISISTTFLQFISKDYLIEN